MKRLTALAALFLIAASPAVAQTAPPAAAFVGKPRTILFVGNSFTQGAHSAVKRYRANTVTDLNGDGYGGVPALFKTFTEQVGLNYTVSLETQGGRTLGFHWAERRQLLDRAWDVVILQELSTLDRDRPGDAAGYRIAAPQFAAMFARANPRVNVLLMATWARADLVYQPGSPWSGKPLSVMTQDLRRASDGVRALSPTIKGVLPVGEAWTRAIAAGIADPDPYDGIAFGQVDLWTYDHYHASIYGYYLEALVVFGRVTGIDPTRLGAKERAADDLGIAPQTAVALQQVARDQLAGS
ncbi:PEP-CTERM sorting domain-containing protein [Sphingomonas panacisoli]|uniref:PEP-CTERM sorting domain-containing protein n=1 Tax=Sphingomonas panacisoli TaxID=1813879 RepID=A0A5B8LM89_9SPHN|nr:PEP-CTERM sorting domain-containing protein [Sphingomonas panacisoli]QDZ09206.1 PEP-CTERM sorting domain-containing protein [Sphingomonas panacisoli]